MITVYPFASGSLFTASYAVTSSYAISSRLVTYVESASNANVVLNPVTGPRGKSVCLLTTQQYNSMVSTGQMEICNIPG